MVTELLEIPDPICIVEYYHTFINDLESKDNDYTLEQKYKMLKLRFSEVVNDNRDYYLRLSTLEEIVGDLKTQNEIIKINVELFKESSNRFHELYLAERKNIDSM